MLNDRRQQILRALIEEYIAYALPVGSRTLTERYSLGVSPATVRNDLSALEEEGYIVQPHTSAGRIPTDSGYREFVDSLLENHNKTHDALSESIANDIKQNASELDSLLESATATLARLTDCLSVVLAPSVVEARIKQVSLISLTAKSIVIVLVTNDGDVFNRNVDFDAEIDVGQLASIQNALNEIFAHENGSASSVEKTIQTYAQDALKNPVAEIILQEIFLCLRASKDSHAYHGGMTSLLSKPEFNESRSLVPLMEVLENNTVLLQLLDDTTSLASPHEVRVHIGSENKGEALSGVSVIASKYSQGNTQGLVAVIGPTRMDYSKVIDIVEAASSALDDL